MQEELWKPFPWFKIPFSDEDMYFISNLWRVKSQRYSRSYILNTNINTSGYEYFQFTLYKKRYSFLVHRAVLIAFEWLSDSQSEVNHKNWIKTDNRLENLEWCSRSHNMQHAHDTGLKYWLKWPDSHLYWKTWVNHPKSKPVKQKLSDGTVIHIWESMMEVEKTKGWKRSAISRACRMKLRAYWFFWDKE